MTLGTFRHQPKLFPQKGSEIPETNMIHDQEEAKDGAESVGDKGEKWGRRNRKNGASHQKDKAVKLRSHFKYRPEERMCSTGRTNHT